MEVGRNPWEVNKRKNNNFITSDMEVDENNTASASHNKAASEEMPMEIDEDTSEQNPTVPATPASTIKVMASSGTVGSVSISLHPLVIMNISEHWTRLRAQEGSDQLGEISLLILLLIAKFILNSVDAGDR